MKITEDTVEFIKLWETNGTPILEAYFDYKQYSIGYGTRSYRGETITAEEAEKRFRVALEGYAHSLSKRIEVDLSPEQETALISAAYNLGVFGIRSVVELINMGKKEEAIAHLNKFVFAGGKKLDALVQRRAAETRLLEVDKVTRGEPRVQYDRTYWLMPPDATKSEFRHVASMAFNNRSTIGFSADDAGIGDLKIRKVILVAPNRQPKGIHQWFETFYPDVEVTAKTLIYPEIEIPAPEFYPHPTWTPALVGVHGSADGNWGNPMSTFNDLEIAKKAKVEAWKFLSNENADSVDELRNYNSDIFIMVRLFAHKEDLSIDTFMERIVPQVSSFYNKGIRHFEVHNEPNLQIEGMWSQWHNGGEFADWFSQICQRLRGQFAGILLGFPGLSPGHSIPDMRYDAIEFLLEAEQAQTSADWIGAHCYWENESDMISKSGGMWYKRLNTDKPILITEFSNPSPNVSKDTKAIQYVSYYDILEGVHSAYSFVSSASSGFDNEIWAGSSIPETVGLR